MNENDPILVQTFKQLIEETFQEGKHFFVARIRSRLSDESQRVHNHFFAAQGILKLIFQKRGPEFVGRFHEKHPISVKNPVTNQVSSSGQPWFRES